MKNLLKVLAILLATPFLTAAIPLASAETIHSFDADIQIVDADTMVVTETIVYDFGNAERHGIYRSIPGNIIYLEVTDENGTPRRYTVNKNEAKIGDPYITITGEHTYRIVYEVKNGLGFFRHHDELYWNVNGTKWNVPIESVFARVTFPYAFNPDDPALRTACFTGYQWKAGTDCADAVNHGPKQTVFTFQTTRPLKAGENLTLAASIPRTFTEKEPRPTPWTNLKSPRHIKTGQEKIIEFLIEDGNIFFLLPALILVTFSFLSWKKHGKDPRARIPVVAEYEPPDNLTAAELNLFLYNRLKPNAVTATLFELGVKGILEIRKTTEKEPLTFRRRRAARKDELTPFQEYVYKKVFLNGKRSEINVTKLKFKLANYAAQDGEMMERFIANGYYETAPSSKKRWTMIFIGILTIISGGFIREDYPWGLFVMFASGTIIIVFGALMTKKTQKGIDLTQRIKGFRHFMEVTEKRRLSFHNPPAQTLTLFEKMLPYATALGVERQWIKSFKPLIEQQSDRLQITWLALSALSDVNASHLARDLSSISVITQTQSSGGSGGGSGFSGGSSGGGGGGGGGGSW